jgi:hypothetical protein
LPFVKKRLLETNYEGLGEDDAKEFEREFNEILNLATKALEQEPRTFKWCTDCREYDQEKHCCHRWSKAIRNTVEEMKQEYIERDVLDKIRAEILEEHENAYAREDNDTAYGLSVALDILDKYKAERED